MIGSGVRRKVWQVVWLSHDRQRSVRKGLASGSAPLRSNLEHGHEPLRLSLHYTYSLVGMQLDWVDSTKPTKE